MLDLQDKVELVASCGDETIRFVDSVIHLPIPQYIIITRNIVQMYPDVFLKYFISGAVILLSSLDRLSLITTIIIIIARKIMKIFQGDYNS
jgi:hypothetical protein